MINPKTLIKLLNRIQDIGSNREGYIRLDKNERTIPFPRYVFDEIISSIKPEDITTYPDQAELYTVLSNFHGIKEDHILLTPGCDAGIKYIFDTYIENTHTILTLWPTYAMVDVYIKMFGAKSIKIGFKDNLILEYDKFLNSLENIRLVYIANPNQPTGTILTENQIEEVLIKAMKNNIIVIIDEAYLQFSNQKSSIRLVKKFLNLIVLQTFSKAFGLASVRLGYLVSQPQNINFVNKVKPILDINIFAIKCAIYLLNNYHIVTKYVDQIKLSKNYIEKTLLPYNIKCYKGHGNFIHLKIPNKTDINLISRAMKDRGYLIRTAGSGLPAVLEGCIRITVGPLEQMKIFVHDLIDIITSIYTHK